MLHFEKKKNNDELESKLSITLKTKNNKFINNPDELDDFNEALHSTFLEYISYIADPQRFDEEIYSGNREWYAYRGTFEHMTLSFDVHKRAFPNIQSFFENFEIEIKAELDPKLEEFNKKQDEKYEKEESEKQ